MNTKFQFKENLRYKVNYKRHNSSLLSRTVKIKLSIIFNIKVKKPLSSDLFRTVLVSNHLSTFLTFPQPSSFQSKHIESYQKLGIFFHAANSYSNINEFLDCKYSTIRFNSKSYNSLASEQKKNTPI